MTPVTNGGDLFSNLDRPAGRGCGAQNVPLVGGYCAGCIKGRADYGPDEAALDQAKADAARDAAMDQVEENADDDWKRRAFDVLASYLRHPSPVQEDIEPNEVTADDLWRFIEKPREARAAGPIFSRAARAGLCEDTGRMVRSRQPGCHSMPRRVWRSLVAGQPSPAA